MESYLVFFLGALSFLFGIACGSLGLPAAFILVPAAAVFAALYADRIDMRVAALASLLVIAGFAYYLQDDVRYQAAVADVPASGTMEGVLSSDPKMGERNSTITLSTKRGSIIVFADPSSGYAYGDTLSVTGKFSPPSSVYVSRHVVAVTQSPSIERISQGNGNPAIAFLLRLKHSIKSGYDDALSPERSAFLFGIMFGDNGFIPKTFGEKLDTSGLRFITAIDGLHMFIVIMILYGVLEWVLPRKYAALLTAIFSLCYVALTGFTVSGIRASLMALVASFARETRRVNVSHNTLVLAALVLALMNPKVLFFDVGFQLSIIAVIAIVYLMPMLRFLLDRGGGSGTFDWKDALLITFSVQIATAPITMSQFQSFSFTSWISSMAVVPFLPVIIGSGFVLALFGLFPLLAHAFSLLVSPLISYAMLVVTLFSHYTLLFNPSFGFTGVVVYYGVLIGAMLWFYRERTGMVAKKERVPMKVEPTGFEITEI